MQRIDDELNKAIFDRNNNNVKFILENSTKSKQLPTIINSYVVDTNFTKNHSLKNPISKKLSQPLQKIFNTNGFSYNHLVASVIASNAYAAKKLIKYGFPLDYSGQKLNTPSPLFVAVIRNNITLVELLIKAGAKISQKCQFKEGTTANFFSCPLEIAIESESVDFMRLLLMHSTNTDYLLLRQKAKQNATIYPIFKAKIALDKAIKGYENKTMAEVRAYLNLAFSRDKTLVFNFLEMAAADCLLNASKYPYLKLFLKELFITVKSELGLDEQSLHFIQEKIMLHFLAHNADQDHTFFKNNAEKIEFVKSLSEGANFESTIKQMTGNNEVIKEKINTSGITLGFINRENNNNEKDKAKENQSTPEKNPSNL